MSKVTQSAVINPKFEGLTKLSKPALDEHLKQFANKSNSFPLEIFPDEVKEIIQQKAECLGYPIDFTCAAHFHAPASVIGNTYRSNFNGYEVTTNLFMSFVGFPGSNKSQPIKDAYAPIERKDTEAYISYERALERYEADKIAFSKKEISEQPKEPILNKTIVSDITIEALAQVCAKNKRGVCSYVDEQAGWIKDMNKYSNGGVQEVWLSVFNCAPFNVDRTSRKSIRVTSPCISVIGTIQPKTLDELAKENRNDNGFRDRLLFIKPANLKAPLWSKKRFDNSIQSRWALIINRLFNELTFTTGYEGEEVSNYIPFTPEAEDLLIEWQNKCKEEDLEIDNQTRYSISAKIDIYVLRFALIIQLLRWSCQEAGKDSIDKESARRAVILAEYFKEQGLNVANYINSKSPIEDLPENKRRLFLSLPKQFTTAEGKSIVDQFNNDNPDIKLPERTFEYWLNDLKLFTKVSHGNYMKNY